MFQPRQNTKSMSNRPPIFLPYKTRVEALYQKNWSPADSSSVIRLADPLSHPVNLKKPNPGKIQSYFFIDHRYRFLQN
jgi:hypothetical protein